jgi:hypothetical protein
MYPERAGDKTLVVTDLDPMPGFRFVLDAAGMRLTDAKGRFVATAAV